MSCPIKLPPRFWNKVDKRESCWLWTGCVTHFDRYARFVFNGKAQTAHRLTYIEAKGSIPSGLQLDHLCRVRHCVNPDHLEAVTRKENILRGEGPSAQNARKKQCNNGHKFSYKTRLERTQRFCAICNRNKEQTRIQNNKEEIKIKRKAYWQANREEINAKARARYQTNKIEILAKRKAKQRGQLNVIA
jgi:hypothetical protein